MSDFRIDRATVEGKEKGDVAWLVIEPAFNDLETPYEPDPRLDELSDGQRAAYVLHWTASEIYNGGLEQFYDNSTGMLAPLAPWAARHVGATGHADVLERANGQFPGGEVPTDREERQQALEETDEDALVALQEEFYALEDRDDQQHDLQSHIAAYVREHPEEFFVD